MNISRNTREQLIVGDRPLFFAGFTLVLGLVLLAAGLAVIGHDLWPGLALLAAALATLSALLVFGRRAQFIFDAAQSTLTVQRKSLRDASTVIHALQDVERAELEVFETHKGDMKRVHLILTGESAGRHPIGQVPSTIGNHQGVHDAINTWLAAYKAAR